MGDLSPDSLKNGIRKAISQRKPCALTRKEDGPDLAPVDQSFSIAESSESTRADTSQSLADWMIRNQAAPSPGSERTLSPPGSTMAVLTTLPEAESWRAPHRRNSLPAERMCEAARTVAPATFQLGSSAFIAPSGARSVSPARSRLVAPRSSAACSQDVSPARSRLVAPRSSAPCSQGLSLATQALGAQVRVLSPAPCHLFAVAPAVVNSIHTGALPAATPIIMPVSGARALSTGRIRRPTYPAPAAQPVCEHRHASRPLSTSRVCQRQATASVLSAAAPSYAFQSRPIYAGPFGQPLQLQPALRINPQPPAVTY